MGEQGTGRAPARVRKDHDERRAQILACARTLFRERPYEEVSNTEIAAAAGVSRGLLNHYFGTKRELYLAALEEMLHVPPIPVPTYVAGASVRDRIAESIEGWLELLERNAQTWLAAVERASSGGDPQLGALLDDARERAVDRIVEVVGIGRLAAEHPQVRAILRGYSGMAEAISQEWLKRGRLTRREAHIVLEDALLDVIFHVLPRITGESLE